VSLSLAVVGIDFFRKHSGENGEKVTRFEKANRAGQISIHFYFESGSKLC
jgi:hypothetical protein